MSFNNSRRFKPLVENVDFIIDDLGSTYTDIRTQCLSYCSRLMDTHEATNAEKDCAKNCFEKVGKSYFTFTRLANGNTPGQDSWKEFVKDFNIDTSVRDRIQQKQSE